MVYYPIQTLVNAGIEEILLVTGGKNAGDFLRLLGNGRDFGLKHLNYTYQEGEGGIAEALGLAEYLRRWRADLRHSGRQHHRKQCLPGRGEFWEAERRCENPTERSYRRAPIWRCRNPRARDVVGIEEKPKAPKSNFAVIGIYLYDATVLQKIRRLKPSGRGELEITDVNNFYIEEDQAYIRNARWLVDRCRAVRITSSRQQSGRRNRRE